MTSNAMSRVVRGVDLAMLKCIAAEDVTWRADIDGRRSYRLWCETGYVTCTKTAARVIDRGWASAYHGYMHGCGGVDLTAEGRKVLEAHSQERQP